MSPLELELPNSGTPEHQVVALSPVVVCLIIFTYSAFGGTLFSNFVGMSFHQILLGVPPALADLATSPAHTQFLFPRLPLPSAEQSKIGEFSHTELYFSTG